MRCVGQRELLYEPAIRTHDHYALQGIFSESGDAHKVRARVRGKDKSFVLIADEFTDACPANDHGEVIEVAVLVAATGAVPCLLYTSRCV